MEIFKKAGQESRYFALQVNKLFVVVMYGERRMPSQVCNGASCFECLVTIIGVLRASKISRNDELHLLGNGRWRLPTGRDCLNRTVHKDFEVQDGRSPGIFVLVPRSEGTVLLVCSTLHTNAHYPKAKKKKLDEVLRLEEVAILAYFVSVEHG